MVDKNSSEIVINHWRLEEWFPDLSPAIQKKFHAYHQELVRLNKTSNLVSVKSLSFSDALHFSDGILSSRIIVRHNPQIKEIYDFGSGAGFPGLVFAMLNPNISVKLVEHDPKKCEFLASMIKMLGAGNATLLSTTVEALPDNSIQYCMARGFSNVSRTCMAARKPVVKGGALFHLKGEEWAIEVSEMPSQLCSLWSPSLVGDYKLPIGSVKFSILKTDKIQ
jgi:16S rRNA (guanine527-N7)-methyltransferase